MADTRVEDEALGSALTGTENFYMVQGGGPRKSTTDMIAIYSANPPTNDGRALGSAALQWSDLFLASGGIINFGGGNYTVTHASGQLSFSGPIGVGTAVLDPSATVHGFKNVNNSADMLIANPNAGAAANANFVLITDQGTAGFLGQMSSANTSYAGVNSLNLINVLNAPLAFGTNNAIRMIVTPAGLIGIGTLTAPSTALGQKLELAVSANFGGSVLSTWSTAAAEAPIFNLYHSKSATIGTHAAVTTNDALGYINYGGSDGTAFQPAASVRAFVDGAVAAGQVPGRLEMYTTSAAGVSTKQAAIDKTGLLTLTAGQIAFPAAQNASAGANTLDDYEEGTWTPSVGGSATYTTQVGTYTKVGRFVHTDMHLVINAIGTGNPATISGLPFTPAQITAGSVGFAGTLAVNPVSIFCYGTTGSAIQLAGWTVAAASMTNPLNALGNAADIYCQCDFNV